MKRLFLDANVLFTAAHNPSGKAALIIELATMGCSMADFLKGLDEAG